MTDTRTHTHTRITWVQEKWNAEDLRPIGCDNSVFYNFPDTNGDILSLFINDPDKFTYKIVCDGSVHATLWTDSYSKPSSTKVGVVTNSRELFALGITNDVEYEVAVSMGRLVVIEQPRFAFTDTSKGITTYSDIVSLSEAVNLGFRFATKYLPK